MPPSEPNSPAPSLPAFVPSYDPPLRYYHRNPDAQIAYDSFRVLVATRQKFITQDMPRLEALADNDEIPLARQAAAVEKCEIFPPTSIHVL